MAARHAAPASVRRADEPRLEADAADRAGMAVPDGRVRRRAGQHGDGRAYWSPAAAGRGKDGLKPMTFPIVLFAILAIISVGASVWMISTRNPVRSALFLV